MVATAGSVTKDSTINSELMSGYTGVRITDVAITDMTDDQIEEVRQLVSTYCAAVFPDQFLRPEDHVAFIARFAPRTVTPGVDLHPD